MSDLPRMTTSVFRSGHYVTELSAAEQRVYDYFSQGYSAKYIGEKLDRSKKTIESQVEKIYRKLGITCRDELVDHRLSQPDPVRPAPLCSVQVGRVPTGAQPAPAARERQLARTG